MSDRHDEQHDDQHTPTFHVTITSDRLGPVVEKGAAHPRWQGLIDHERHVLASLVHPNVVELAEAQVDGPLRTILAGRTTAADRPPADVVELTAFACQLTTVLAEVHAGGWSHGAVEADHCVIDRSGGLVLCGWRRAAPIDASDSPAAADDVRAVLVLLRAQLDRLGDRGSTDARALAALLAKWDGAPRPPAMSEIARQLGNGASLRSGVRSRSPRPFRRPDPDPVRDHRRRGAEVIRAGRQPAQMSAMRAVTCIAAAVFLWYLHIPHTEVVDVGAMPRPIALAASVLRALALACAGYGAIVNTIGWAAAASGSTRLRDLSERVGPTRLRRVATGVTSLGVLGSLSAISATHSTRPLPAPEQPIPPRPTPTSPTTTALPTTTANLLPEPAPAPVPEPAPVLDPAPTTPPTLIPPAAVSSEWIVQPGDHLWRIASDTLRDAWGLEPDDHQIDAYWRRLIMANRNRFRDAANPDLIFPGQRFELPPPPAPPDA